jgi:FixJ family two-component response regulator
MRRQNLMLPVIFLTGHATVAASVTAMKAGAVDFLTKPVKREALLDALQRALAADAARRAAQADASRLQARFASLTPRQRQVFDHIVAGKLNKQIAYELDIAERTVKREREQVMLKLDANSVADLGRLAELLHQSPVR